MLREDIFQCPVFQSPLYLGTFIFEQEVGVSERIEFRNFLDHLARKACGSCSLPYILVLQKERECHEHGETDGNRCAYDELRSDGRLWLVGR